MTTGWQIAFAVVVLAILLLTLIMVTTMRQVGVISLSLRPTDQGLGPLLNAQAPAIDGADALTGSDWRLHSSKRDAQVLFFLSMHCDSCRALVPFVNEFAADRPDVRVAAMIPGSREDARRFVDLTGLRVPTLSDHDTQAFALYNVTFTPHAVAIDANARVIATTPVKNRDEIDQLVPQPGYARPDGSNQVVSAVGAIDD